LVVEVAQDGPAEHAGIKLGDVIIEFNGKQIKDAEDLPLLIARTTPGDEAQVKLLRDKEELTIAVRIEKLKDEEVNIPARESDHLGLTVQKVTPEIAKSQGVKRAEGVIITSVEPGSAADEAGLEEDDIIIEVNRTIIHDVSEYKNALMAAQEGKRILFLVRRGENAMFLTLKP